MLIEFSVANFRSIKEMQTLRMTANSAKELLENNSFLSGLPRLPRLLRSAVVYGPNASGKSNLIKALRFMRRQVLSSAKSQEGENIRVKPFLFDQQTQKGSSEFEILFIDDNVRYQYGFSVNSIRVTGEWLIAYPEGKAQHWFERKFDPASEKEEWDFGSKFKGLRQIWQDATRKNALFLSTAVQLNNEQLKPVFNWFGRKLRFGDSVGSGFTAGQCEMESRKRRIIEFMAAADLSIADIRLETKETAVKLPRGMPQPLKDRLLKELPTITEVKFFHLVNGSQDKVALDFSEESAGTQKLFDFAGPLLDTLDNGYVLLVDELNSSLHPLMVRFLIGLFHDPETNRKNAQLIFTTHDTSVLDQDIFRRDQIWFMEKDKGNATKLYPLSDFSPRKGEALEKGYLHGRYGALPCFGELRFDGV